MRDIIFLFGAGASYGAGGIVPESPPLGSALYAALAESYPSSWGSLPIDVRDVIAADFERGMKMIYDSHGIAVPALMREMAVYLIQFRPYQRRTLYNRLLEDLVSARAIQRVLMSTLNYDCVLEFCALDHGHQIEYFDDSFSGAVPIWKLHGSCNMFSHGMQAGPGISYSTGVIFEGGIEALLDPNAVTQRCLVETALAPVMCLYMPGKLLNVSPSAIKALQDKWRQRVNDAALILTVGVRPVSEDAHIWSPIATSNAPLCYVGNRESLQAWSAASGRKGAEFLGSRFGDAYHAIMERVTTYATH